jgi:hypothetical protein
MTKVVQYERTLNRMSGINRTVFGLQCLQIRRMIYWQARTKNLMSERGKRKKSLLHAFRGEGYDVACLKDN